MTSKRKDSRVLGNEPEDDTGESGQGGKSGSIEFKDFLYNPESQRDDLLPVDVLKRLVTIHQSGNETRIKKQKGLLDERAKLKNGKISLVDYRKGLIGSEMKSNYKAHPAFEKSAQFHDSQVSAVPTENIEQTNDELQNKLQNEYQKKYLPEYTPRPQSAPKLTR